MNPSTSSSSNHSRPSSRAQDRPPSSASRRPLSAAGRPLSSASVRKTPANYALNRPSSSASTRFPARPSSRASTRLSTRLLPQYQQLVAQVASLDADKDSDGFQAAVEYVAKNLEFTSKAGPSMDMGVVGRKIHGLAEKANIQSNDNLAAALRRGLKRLNEHIAVMEHDLDHDIKASHLPDHMQLLLSLSVPPTHTTLNYAHDFLYKLSNPLPHKPGLTWKDILADEPFEGDHWEGAYGLPPGFVKGREESSSGGSTPSLSPLDPDDLEDDTSSLDSSEGSEGLLDVPETSTVDDVSLPDWSITYSHRRAVEDLQSRQYWRPGWKTDARLSRLFNIGDASTLGPALRRVIAAEPLTLRVDGPEQETYIHEHDAVREILISLQGRENLMLEWIDEPAYAWVPSKTAPRLLHFTLTAETSLLASFATVATDLERLRRFAAGIIEQSTKRYRDQGFNSRTLGSFADAISAEIRTFERWCAACEEDICRAYGGGGPVEGVVVSFLRLEKMLRDTFDMSFHALLEVLESVLLKAGRTPAPLSNAQLANLGSLPIRISPSALTSLLLDALLDAVQAQSVIGNAETSEALVRIFSRSAEPVWDMLRVWLKDGAPLRDDYGSASASNVPSLALDPEFFVEDNELILLDADFWAEGYVLRQTAGGDEDEEGSRSVTPLFLQHVASHILSAGKSVALLRSLGHSATNVLGVGTVWLADWTPFSSVIRSLSESSTQMDVVMTTEILPQVVFDEVVVQCRGAQIALTEILVSECGLWNHLAAIEDLYLMRRGDAISHFTDKIFGRMDANQPRNSWNDFHFLNSAFRDVAAVTGANTPWINSDLVRFSYRRGKQAQAMSRTVRVFEGLTLEYAVPFPLIYIFTPTVLQCYCGVFVMLLQIQRAKTVLERILVRGAVAKGADLKVFYALRGKLSWFVNTLLNFVATNVLHTQIMTFHSALSKAQSLDEMISIHEDHTNKIQSRCLLQENTAGLHRAILSVLDMCLYFSECFVAFAGDTTLDISRSVLTTKKHRHRSQRLRRQQRNVISFSNSTDDILHPPVSDSSESETDEDPHPIEPSFSLGTSMVSLADEGFFDRVDKMASELDGLVRFIRRSVEGLAGGGGEAAPAFGQFAFALEDWDR